MIDPSQGTRWWKALRALDRYASLRGAASRREPRPEAEGERFIQPLARTWGDKEECSRSMRGGEPFPASAAAAAARSDGPFALGDSARASHRHRRTTVVASGSRDQASPASVVESGLWLWGSCYPACLHRRCVLAPEGCHGLQAREVPSSRGGGRASVKRSAKLACERSERESSPGRYLQKSGRSSVRPRVGSVIAEVLGRQSGLESPAPFLSR